MNDRITKIDKIEYVRNEQLKRKAASGASTYFQQSLIDLNLEGGRYSNAGPNVIGRDVAAQYPHASSPWSSSADVGVEPSLGEDINFVAPVGEAHEVAASIAEQELGAPEAGAMTQGTHPPLRPVEQSPESALQVAGAPPSVDRGCAPLTQPSAYLTQASSPVLSTSRSTLLDAPDDPPDGLVGLERRTDGTALSSHTMKRRKL